MPKLSLTTSLLKNRLNLFYILAFAPLILIQIFGYVSRQNFFAALFPLCGFLLLLIKKDKLSAFAEANRLSKIMGLILMSASFFVYYAVAFFFPLTQFYGGTNYTVYVIGLFLLFFQISALKESFTTVFLIVAASGSGFVGKQMEFLLEPWVPYFVQIMEVVLWILGIPAKIADSTVFRLRMPDGNVLYLGVAAGCMGIYSFLAFAVIIVVTMVEISSGLRTKLLWSVAGVIGTFFINIVRVSLIFVVIYYFGYENWGRVHTSIGYVLFIVWLAFFFLIFSKRQFILGKLQTLLRKLRRSRKYEYKNLSTSLSN